MDVTSTTSASNLNEIQELKDLIRRIELKLTQNPSEELAEELTALMCSTTSSIYYSQTLESFYIELAQKNATNTKAQAPQKNSILHVMTMCYTSGGHTRVVERWIQSAPKGETHSVTLLDQLPSVEIPQLLRQITKEKGGRLIIFEQGQSITKKANELRELAQEYEYIILHHHMHDPVPLMAFGLPQFDKPVITFNHAGHLFWLGRNATDLVIDIEESQRFLTTQRRGIKNSIVCPLPFTNSNNNIKPDKEALRLKLDLPLDAPILVSMAQAYKYTNALGYNFKNVIRDILNRSNKSIAIIIGVPSNYDDDWRQLENDYPKRVHLLGVMPHSTATQWLGACDLYIDSFPYNSFTSLVDAISIGKLPALSLQTPVGTLPCIKGTSASIKSQNNLSEATIEILHNKAKRITLQKSQEASLKSLSPENFQKSIQSAYTIVSKIKKDTSRFCPPRKQITEFDIISNLVLSGLHNTQIRTNRRSILRGIITKETKTIGSTLISKSTYVLGVRIRTRRFPSIHNKSLVSASTAA